MPTAKVFTGGEKVNIHLLKIAKQANYETELFELDISENKIPKWIKKLISIRYLGRAFKSIYFLAVSPKCYKSICFTDYYSVKDLFFYLLILRVFFRCINLCYFHQLSSDIYDLRTSGKIKTLRDNISLLVFNLVLVNSEFNKKVVLSLRVPEKRIRVLYPLLIDRQIYNSKNDRKSNAKIRFLFVGGSFKRKGILCAIKAIKLLNRKDIEFNIVGDINKEKGYVHYLMKMVIEDSLNDQIRFLGRVDDKTLDSLWRNSDVFLFPTLFEGFGIVITEAMLYQLPIISTNVTAIPELVEDGESGILVPPEDPHALAMAIEKLANNNDLRKKMGESGYNRINELYESFNIEAKFRNILEELERESN